MKPTTPVKSPAVLLLALLLIVTALLLPGRISAAAKDATVNVDYVIALLDSGMERAKIVERIESQGLTFRLAPGDLPRLRAAGADDKVIDAVVDHAAVLEGQGQAAPPAQGTDRWGRPSRLGNSGEAGSGQEQAAPPADGDQQYEQYGDDGQGIEETPYGGGSYGYYPGYYTGYYNTYYGYPYPYYYSYPYGSYFYYSSPYYSYYYPHRYYRYGFSGQGGGGRTVPRGTHSMGSPRPGGGSHSSPRTAPRGSHH